MKILKALSFILIAGAFMLPAFAQKNISATNIDKITNAYLDVKNALVAGDGNAAESKSGVLLAALSEKLDKNLNPAQQKLLAVYLDKLKYDSRHISQTNVIAHQREHFANLSKNLYEVLKGLKMNSLTIYEQYCPMKKSYWLSETAAIKNPYYGKQMLECGETTKTLVSASK